VANPPPSPGKHRPATNPSQLRQWSHPHPVRVVGRDNATVVESARDFVTLEDEWRALWTGAADRSPFSCWEFASSWWRHFVTEGGHSATGEFRVLVARDERENTLGIAPMFVEHNLGVPAFGTTLQPFGRSNAFETMTDEPMGVLDPLLAGRAVAVFSGHLRTHARESNWDLAVSNTSATVETFPLKAPPALRRQGSLVEVDRRLDGPVSAELPASWEQYRRSLSKSMRDNIAYYPRRLRREVGPFSVQIARRPAEVAAATQDLIHLHRRRSEGALPTAHRSHLPGPRHVAFMSEVMERLAHAGLATVVTLSVGAQVVAAHAFLEAGNATWTYYSGFEPAWSKYSPLTILTAAYLEDAISHGVRQLHFSPGQTPWKARWGARMRQPMQETSIYSLRPKALVRGVLRRLRWGQPSSKPRLAPVGG
jgi:CelD/BcsL family acetyltransferase involved in cellulose biosynthesis